MDIISVLRDEHRQVMDLFGKFEGLQEESAKQAVAEELAQQLMVHEEAEEDAVYSKVRGRLEQPGLIDTALQEQSVLKGRLRDLVSQANPALLDSRISAIKALVRQHVETEENRIFPQMEQRVDTRMREQLASAFKSAKANRMAEMPSLTITMAPEVPTEARQRT